MIRIIAGDSYWKDYTSPQVETFDSNWTGSYAIAATIGGTALASGSISKSLDQTAWEVRIPGTATAQTPGDYYLIIQFKNSVTGFCREIQEPMQITAQGIA